MKRCAACAAQLPVPGLVPQEVNGHDVCGSLTCMHAVLSRDDGKPEEA